MVIRTHYDLGQIVNVKRVAGQKKKDGKWILNHEWRPGKIYEIIVKITKFNPLSYITYVIYDLENQKARIDEDIKALSDYLQQGAAELEADENDSTEEVE